MDQGASNYQILIGARALHIQTGSDSIASLKREYYFGLLSQGTREVSDA